MQFFIVYISAIIGYWAIDRYISARSSHVRLSGACPAPNIAPTDIVLKGDQFGLNEETIHGILSKRFPYYTGLSAEWQARFVNRVCRFMHDKIFIIKDERGVREMPVLISAAAVQLTFGLKNYRLPFYKYIRIYPKEYISADALKVLAGMCRIIQSPWHGTIFLKA